MARLEAAEVRETYLVEHYEPGLDVDELRRWAGRVRESVVALECEGRPIRYLRSMIIPRDESFLCVVEAASEELVREAYTRARIPFERISTAISDAG